MARALVVGVVCLRQLHDVRKERDDARGFERARDEHAQCGISPDGGEPISGEVLDLSAAHRAGFALPLEQRYCAVTQRSRWGASLRNCFGCLRHSGAIGHHHGRAQTEGCSPRADDGEANGGMRPSPAHVAARH